MPAAHRSQPPNPEAPEAEFERFVLQNIELAENLLAGYRFIGLRTLISEHGAVETAKRLLDPGRVGNPYDGFNMLAKWELLHLSLEQAVVAWKTRGLFHASLIAAAEVRLSIALKRGAVRRLNS